MTDKIVVLSTCSSSEEAERLARLLIETRLAACVNVLPQIRSFYRWESRTEDSVEYLLVIKSSRHLFDDLQRLIRVSHSYATPELIALPVITGSPDYLNWMESELQAGPE